MKIKSQNIKMLVWKCGCRKQLFTKRQITIEKIKHKIHKN